MKNNFTDYYANSRMVVTGGASFIGSHLVERLLSFGAFVTVLDNFTSGSREYLQAHTNLQIIDCDLRNKIEAGKYLRKNDFIFHLAAIHGGRGFIDTQESEILQNFAIDNNVFQVAAENQVSIIVSASSACAYPVTLQENFGTSLLKEMDANIHEPGKAFPDGVYGWVKLIGELQLETISKSSKILGRAARIFTSYGPRENESHAATALIAKALLKFDPYPIWGSGEQLRNFTFVDDTVEGLLRLGMLPESIKFQACNIGGEKQYSVNEFIQNVFEQINWWPREIKRDLSAPIGVNARASDNNLTRDILNWEPNIALSEGISKTIEWYSSWPSRALTKDELTSRLFAR